MKKLLLLLCALPIFLSAEVVDRATGAKFPSQVSFDGYTLNATGVATRKKFIVKVYSIASYLQQEATTANEIMDPQYAKQLTLIWQRDVGGDRVKAGYVESMKAALSKDEYASIQSEAEQFLALFDSGVKEKDEHIYRWAPGGIVTVLINGGSVLQIESQEFAHALWSIWFGRNSVVDKKALTSLLK